MFLSELLIEDKSRVVEHVSTIKGIRLKEHDLVLVNSLFKKPYSGSQENAMALKTSSLVTW